MGKIASKIPTGSFWLRTDREDKNGECQIVLRYFCMKYVFISTGISTRQEWWDSKKGEVKNGDKGWQEKNGRLKRLKLECDGKIMEFKGDFNPANLKDLLLGDKHKYHTFFEFAEDANRSGYERGLYAESHFINRKNFLKAYLVWCKERKYEGYGVEDMVTKGIMAEYARWLMQERKASTAKTYLINLRCMVRDACNAGIIDERMLKKAFSETKISTKTKEYNEVTEEEDKEVKYLTKEQIRALEEFRDKCDNEKRKRHLDSFLFSYYSCGLRLSDVVTLKWSDINGNVIDKPMVKMKRKQSILPVISKKGMEILERYRANKTAFCFGYFNDDYDFTGLKINLAHIISRMDASLKCAGVAIGCEWLHFHCARHSFCVHTLSAGIDIRTVAALMGHKNTSMIEQTYGAYLDEYQEDVREKISVLLDE